MSLRRVVAVPRRARADVPSVVQALGALLSRHSSLRTRLRLAGDRPEQQVVVAADQLPVRLVHARDEDSATAAQAVAESLAATPFDHAAELPQRVALVLAGERVRHVVLVFSHTTVDFLAVEILLRELRLLLLRGTIATPPGPQSVDIAHREQGPDQHRTDRAIGYWLDRYARLPGTVLPAVAPPLAPRFRRAVLTSPAADTATRSIATSHRVGSSAVLIAATAAVITAWSGTTVCGIHTMTNNRALPGYRDAIAKLNQLGLLVVDVADRPTFAELLPRVWQAALRGYRHAHYDPVRMEQALASAGHWYAPDVNPHCYLNDIRLSTEADLYGRATAEAEVRAAMGASSLSWAEQFERFSWSLRVEIMDLPSALGIALTADTSHLPPTAMERFLLAIERVLVEAAFDELPWPWLPDL